MRDVYLTERVGEARTLLKKAIVGCKSDEVAVRGQFPVRSFGHQKSAPLAVIPDST